MDFNDLEEALGIPSGSTDMKSKKSIKQVETAMTQTTNELVQDANALVTEPKSDIGTDLDIANDANIEVVDQLARGKEYIRVKSIRMYESVHEMIEILREELMPGSPASMWMAYASLIKASNECLSKVGDIYQRIESDHGLALITEEQNTDAEEEGTVGVSVDEIMDFLEAETDGDPDAEKLDPNKAIEIVLPTEDKD
jgi:hypothetical protein